MENLLPFLIFILWIVFGTIGSKKKREEAQQRAEAQRAAREAQARARAEQRRAGRDLRDNEGRIRAGEPPLPPRRETAGTGSAADMVPDELWAILTGGAPRPTGPPQTPPRAEHEREYEYAYDEDEGDTPGGWVTSPPWNEEAALDSIEGVSAETIPDRTHDYDDSADRIARARYENLHRPVLTQHPSTDSVAVNAVETSDLRHFQFHDRLKEDEIGSTGAAPRRSTKTRIGLNDMADVRRAIVLAEVLGKPKGLKDWGV